MIKPTPPTLAEVFRKGLGQAQAELVEQLATVRKPRDPGKISEGMAIGFWAWRHYAYSTLHLDLSTFDRLGKFLDENRGGIVADFLRRSLSFAAARYMTNAEAYAWWKQHKTASRNELLEVVAQNLRPAGVDPNKLQSKDSLQRLILIVERSDQFGEFDEFQAYGAARLLNALCNTSCDLDLFFMLQAWWTKASWSMRCHRDRVKLAAFFRRQPLIVGARSTSQR